MSPILEIVGLSKKFHLGQAGRTTLGDVLTERIRRLGGASATRRPAEDTSQAKWLWALRDVTYSVDAGDCVGVIGINGAGKSTLLKILSRITDPTEGFVRIRGRIASLLEVGTGFHPELTGRENIYMSGAMLGMSRAEIRLKFDEIVAFAEIDKFLDTPLKHYSSGMHLRLGFAVAAHLDPEIMIVDEVLAVGDMSFQKKCLGKMSEIARTGRTVIFVSHNMAVVQNLCEKAIVLRGGRLVFSGDAKSAIEHYVHSVSRVDGAANPHTVDLSNAAGRWPRSLQRLRRFEVYTSDSVPCNGFVPIGTPLKLYIHFHLDRLTAEFEHRINFIDLYGQIIFHASSGFEPERRWNECVGDQIFVCEIPSLQLAPGEYRIDVALLIARELVDKVEDVFRVTVLETDYYGTGRVPRWGTCVLKQRWRLD
jgi:lipopolysaccharide transport system ATP-binding protein